MEDLTDPYFINISSVHEALSSVGFVKNTFDFNINLNTFNKPLDNSVDKPVDNSANNSNNNSYNEHYKLYKTFPDKKLITISPYKLASLFTIPAINERYMYRSKNEYLPGDHPKFKSSLNILYISSKPDINTDIKQLTQRELSTCVVSNACGLIKTFTQHNLLLDLSQFIFFGVHKELLNEKLKTELNSYYTYENIKEDKLKKSLFFLKKKLEDQPVHIVFDLDVLSTKISPLSFRDNYCVNENGINLDELMLILQELKTLNIVGLDIVNYFLTKDENSIVNRIQAETIQRIYGNLLNMKVKSFNIFNEFSKFLIFKPVDEIEDDVGWYIMRGIEDLQLREQIMKQIEQDQIITVKINSEEENNENCENSIYITTTTIAEQNELYYFSSDNFLDKCLYPDEKMDMLFELVNV